MSIFSNIKNKLKGIDSFYEEVKAEQIGLYQHYFAKIVRSIDIHTQTSWSQSKTYDREQMKKDEETMEKIIAEEAAAEGLFPAILQVMVNQYFFADIYRREVDKDDWVNTVIYRKNVDYFPSGWQMRALLEKVT